MKKLLYVFAALLAFAACKKELPIATISAVEEFNSEYVAAVTISLSASSKSDVQVLLEGTPADKLTFDDTVVIPAGSSSAGIMVRINPEGIDPQAPIQVYIKDAIGATVGQPAMVTIGLRSYGDNGGGQGQEGGNEGGNEGGEGSEGGEGGGTELPGTLTLVSTWSAALKGDPYTEDGDDWVDLTMSTSGIKYYGVESLFAGELAEYYTDVAGLIESWDEYIADYLAADFEVSDVLFADGEDTYITYPGAGAAQIYIVEFDATGKTTGRYGVSSVVFPEYEGGSSDIEATLVSTWKAEMDGDPYTDDEGDWIDLKMTTPGINYYGVEGILDEDFEYYYESVEELIQDYDSYIAGYLDDGYTVSQLLFANGEYTYIEYPGAGAGKIFIVEFDANGHATGRYGYTAVTFPEFEGSSDGWAKSTIDVPETFTINSSLGVEYQGRYTSTEEDDETGEEVITHMDVFAATGTGESMWAIDIFEPNDFDGDVHAYAADLAMYLDKCLADVVAAYGPDLVAYFYEDLADFLAQELLGTYEGEPFGFDTYENGTYDAIVLTFTDEGDLSGEYNLVKVTVDGHEYVEPDGAPAYAAAARRHFPIGKGLGNLVPARLRHAHHGHTKVAASTRNFAQAKRHPVISSAVEKSAKKSNKICRLK